MRAALGLALLLAGACRPVNQNAPDQVLMDSLGLGEEHTVVRVLVGSDRDRERISPTEVRVGPGAIVEFVTTDRRLHRVSFELDSLTERLTSFLVETGQDASPPLMDLGSRFVVTFADAPLGRYPFVTVGNGGPGRGVVVVDTVP